MGTSLGMYELNHECVRRRALTITHNLFTGKGVLFRFPSNVLH